MGDITYFEKPPTIYPKRVWGRYRKLKWIVMAVLLGIYYLAPFLRYHRGPLAPSQAILIDLPSRRAYFFGIEIWPHEVYYVAGLLVLAAIVLFFVSSLLGRVWCGYACPQTVWTDLFIWVERLVQGDRNARMKLDKSPLSLEKIWKKGLTHFIWIAIGVLTGGAWVLYFNDAPTLIRDAMHLHVSTNVAIWVLGLTFSTYTMAGFAREQVCSYMCPYARFQSAMFDKDTLIISYDKERGEPRGNYKAGASREGLGDCIDCGNCVTVCPTGIDIRNGLQMECIACGMCVDACNNVMDKVNLPRGLIRYDTDNNQAKRSEAKACGTGCKETLNIVRPRTIYYTIVLCAVGGLMLYSLLTRLPLDILVIHDRNPLFVKLSDGSVRNDYDIKIMNMTDDTHHYTLTVSGINDPHIHVEGAGTPKPEDLTAAPDSVAEYRVMIAAHDVAQKRTDIQFILKDNTTGKTASHPSLFINGK
ncbi:MAG TPA: cytochrome c oxidase accessory protein CcoG [Rickettsiales bacterium]|nr:cytochrome c oxidase accessory protein CcoG [Rickettsiales bacterium]